MELPDLSKYQALIFDLDGTLIDSMPFHVKAWIKVSREHGYELDPQLIYDMGGASSRDVVIKLKELGANVPSIDDFYHRKVAAYVEIRDQVPLFPGIAKIAFDAKRELGLKLGIGTGTQRINVDYMIKKFGLDKYFDSVVCGDDVEKHKPFPDTFLKGAEEMGVLPEKCLVFDDGKPGIAAAFNAGMDCIVVDNDKLLELRPGKR